MIVYLVELWPVVKTTGTLTPLRYSSSSTWTTANGVPWLPRLSVPYRRSIQVFDGAFSDQPQDFGYIEVRLQSSDPHTPVSGMGWDGRRARVWKGAPGQNVESMSVVFDGECDSIEATKQGYKINLRGPGFKLSQNALTAFYGGGGDADGTGDLSNTPKPLLLGTAVDVPPVYVDKARGIFQYHGYGAGACRGVFDGGNELQWDGNYHADYASLKAATIAGGYYTRCDPLGMGRHGGAPITNLAIDGAGAAASGTIGDVLTWIAFAAGVAIDTATMSWLNANLPHPQDNFINSQTTFEAIARDMMLKLGGYICYTADGRLSAGLIRRGAAASMTLNRQNLASVSVGKTAPPFYRRRMGYQRAWKVHSYADVRTPREVNPRGAYSAATAYGYYDLVTLGNDSWLHAGEATTTGVAPAEGATWTKFGASVNRTSQLTDDANLGLTALWPSVTGAGKPANYADVTALNTAAAITGQSAWATFLGSTARVSKIDDGGIARIGVNGLLASEAGDYWLTNSNIVTQLGVASAVAGQGVLATLSAVSDGLLSGALAARLAPHPLNANYLTAATIAYPGGAGVDALQPQESGSNKTETRIAAAVTGQGTLATQNSADFDTQVGNLPVGLSRGYMFNGQYLTANQVAWSPQDGSAVSLLKPQEAGSNKTETRTAAAITGQGALATAPQLNASNVFNYVAYNAFSLNHTITRSDGQTVVTESLAITSQGVAAAVYGQGSLATKNQATAADIAPSAVQLVTYRVLQSSVECPVGN